MQTQPSGSESEPAARTDYAAFRTLSEHDRQAIGAIVESKLRITLAQDQVAEDVKATAERLGMKSAELNKIISLAMKERERGNVLTHERALLDVAEQLVFGFEVTAEVKQ